MEDQIIEKIDKPKKRRGGSRKNSGRKASIELIRDKVRKELTAIFWVEMAETVAEPMLNRLMEEGMPAHVRLNVLQEILNRAYGKPKEIREITGAQGGPLQITWET